jgi:hypothetical protein
MTLLLIAAAYFLRAHRGLRERLAEHLPLAEGSNSDTDAGHPQAEITELEIKFDDVRFSVILDRESRSREYRHEFVSSDGETDACNTEGRVPYASPDLKSLAAFVASNSWAGLARSPPRVRRAGVRRQVASPARELLRQDDPEFRIRASSLTWRHWPSASWTKSESWPSWTPPAITRRPKSLMTSTPFG